MVAVIGQVREVVQTATAKRGSSGRHFIAFTPQLNAGVLMVADAAKEELAHYHTAVPSLTVGALSGRVGPPIVAAAALSGGSG